MLRFTCFVFYAVAICNNYVAAISDEDREYIKPILVACVEEIGLSVEVLKSTANTTIPDAMYPCLYACIFMKTGIFNDERKFDLEHGLDKFKYFMWNEADILKLEDYGRQCASVNDAVVSDGDMGCERAMMLVKCFKANNVKLLI